MCVSGILQLPSALVLGLLFGRVFSHTTLQHKENGEPVNGGPKFSYHA